MVVLVRNMTKPLFQRWLLNLPSWCMFIRPTWDPSDVEMRKLARRASGNHA